MAEPSKPRQPRKPAKPKVKPFVPVEGDVRWVCASPGCGYVVWEPPIVNAVSHQHLNTKMYECKRSDLE